MRPSIRSDSESGLDATREVEMDGTFEKMDRMYRFQRHVYDLTRRYYLLGRDELLDRLKVEPGEFVLEAGCGTARNLIKLGRRHGDGNLFGLDASAAMLSTARSNVTAAGLTNIQLRTALADRFSYQETFGLDRPFDKIFFSFSISMIPTWHESLENALGNLAPGGRLFIVDFFDLQGLPRIARHGLWWWLGKFGVNLWDGLVLFLRELEARPEITRVEIRPLYRGYSFIAEAVLAGG